MTGLADGWVVVDYDGPDAASVDVGFGNTTPDEWTPAFLDWAGDRRVAKVRPPELSGRVWVWVRVDGTARHVTTISL